MNHSNPLPRFTERTILRPLIEADLERFQAYRTDPEVARYQGWEQMTDTQARHFIRRAGNSEFLVPGEWYQSGIAERAGGLLIGDAGICVDALETEAEIGFSLDRRYQKQGLGREAVTELIRLIFECAPVARVIGITDERNHPSINLLGAVGMELTATEKTVFRGEPCTELTFSIARDQ